MMNDKIGITSHYNEKKTYVKCDFEMKTIFIFSKSNFMCVLFAGNDL